MYRPPRRVPASLCALAGAMTLLSLLFAAPASADTVSPVRYCTQEDGYREMDGESSAVVTSPDGYLIASYCVDVRGRSGGSEVHVLSTPKRTTVVRHSDGKRLEGYSVSYVRDAASESPEPDTEEDPAGERDDERDGQRDDQRDDAEDTAAPEAEQSAPVKDEKKAPAEKREKAAGTPSASATTSEPEPSRQPSAEISEQPEDSRMSSLSDGEELRITSLGDDDDDENLRSLVVAGGIIIVGLLAGMIALLVRLPGQR